MAYNLVALPDELLQRNLFDDLPIPDGEKVERKKRKYTRRVKKRSAIEQLDLMLECLLTPDSISEIPEQWSDQDVEYLREYMIKSQLKIILDRRAGNESRQEAWEWFLSEDIHPFSFRVCLSALAINNGFVHLLDETIDPERIVTEEDVMLSIDVDELRNAFVFMAKRAGAEVNFCLIE